MLIFALGLVLCWLCLTAGVWRWCSVQGLSVAARPYVWCGWLLATALSAGVYAWLGAAPALHQSLVLQQRVALVRSQWAQDGGASIVAQLQQHVKQHPKADKAWYLLARLQWHRGELAKARQAIDHAVRLSPDQAKYVAFKKQLR